MGKNIIYITKANGSRVPIQNRRTATNATSAKQTWALNAEDTVAITVESPFPQMYDIGDQITIFGRDYKLNRLPKVRKTGTHAFQYDLEFEGIQYDLFRVTYDVNIDTTSNELQDIQGDALTGDLRRFMTVLVANVNRVFPGKWALGVCPETAGDKTLTFGESDNCLSVLQSLCSESNFNVEFEIEKTGGVYTINLYKSVGSVLPYKFVYGRGGGLYELTRENVSSANIVTRLKVYGSTENITSKYRADRLCLPGRTKGQSYIEKADAVAKYGIFEGRKDFDIKPSFTGSVEALVDGSVISFVDTKFPFDLKATNADGETLYLINGMSAKIHFNSGNLAGYDFDVHDYDHATHTFTLVKTTDDRGDQFPSETYEVFRFGVGDEYKITDIAYSSDIEAKAEADLEEAGNTYYDQNCQPKVQYGLSVTKRWLENLVGSDETIVNVFRPGDYLQIVDTDIDVDKSVRVKSFVRNILDEYDYQLTIGDSVKTTSVTNRVLSELIDIDKIIKINNLQDPVKARANWRTSRELLNMVFDPEGDYYTDKIKPNSIETMHLNVGAKSMQFGLTNTVFQPNYNGNGNVVKWQGGVLTHYTINEESAVSWVMADGTVTLTTGTAAYYLYAKCAKTGTAGTFLFTTDQIKVEQDANYYHFLVGTISSIDTELNIRSLSLTYGFSMINGRFIKTGRVESADGTTYFDLDNGEIGGRIVFSSNGEEKTLEELGQEALESKNFINNTLPGLLEEMQAQLDGQIEQFFDTYDPTLENAPASEWTTTALKEAHLGDLFYNTDSGAVYRFVKENGTYKWQQLSDEETAQALALANEALELSKEKNRIFTATPYPPYDVGDLWVQGSTGDIMRCKTARASGSYTSSDWEKASKYTDDSGLNAFINGVFADTITDLTTQVDGKVECWFQTINPALSWTTDAVRAKHVGDMWYHTTNKILYYYTSGYVWKTVEDADALAAYEAASQAQDTADGKRRVFVNTPTVPYDVGDLWVNGQDLRRCQTAKTASQSYNVNDWVVAVNYDNTKTVIDGGLVTSGTIQVAGDAASILAGITGSGTASTSVRFWAGASFENRTTAPFRVLQDGTLYATKANITGTINATAGSFKNVDVYGSFRSPFIIISDSFTEQNSDNIYSQYLGSHLVATLPWTSESSGRKMTVIGSVDITAPTGKYFFEDGRTHQSLSTSYEVVELLGWGTSSGFQGWIVMNRVMFRTNYGHGRRLHPLAFGRVTGTNSGASLKYWSYDGQTLSVQRNSTGKYTLYIPNKWFYSAEYCFVMGMGIGFSHGSSSAPIKVTVTAKYIVSSGSSYITFMTSDDASVNDGSFEFMLYHASTWDD